MKQLDLWEGCSSLTPATEMPKKITVTTFTDPVKGLAGPFNPDLFSEIDADGNPFMNRNSVWIGDEYIGQIFRLYPHMPWQYGFRMGEVKTAGTDFDKAVALLLKERDAYRVEMDLLFANPHLFKVDWKEAKPEKKTRKKGKARKPSPES